MSRTDDSFSGRFIHYGHNRSSMDEIQRYIIKKGKKRSVFFRPSRTKDDSEAIAAWSLNFDRIRRVVEVRCLASAFRLTIVNFVPQTELAKTADANDSTVLPSTSNTNAITSGPHDDVSNAGVPEDRRDVSKTGIIVPAVDRGSAHPHPYPMLSDKLADDHTTASDVHHRTTKFHEDGGSRYRAVSIHLTCPSPSSGLVSPLT